MDLGIASKGYCYSTRVGFTNDTGCMTQSIDEPRVRVTGMKSGSKFCCVLVVVGLIGTCISHGLAAPAKVHGVKLGIRTLLKIEQNYVASLSGEEGPLKKDTKVDVYLQSGKKIEGAVITDVQLGKPKNSFKFVSWTLPKGGKQKLAANTLLHFATDEGVYDVVQDPATKAFLLLDLNRRDELAKERLAKSGYMLWEEPSSEEREQTIEDAKKLFKRTQDLFPDRPFQLHETDFYLFFTDLPAEQVAGYVTNLDTMYRQLCLAFGILPDKNIWKGKCPVLAFMNADQYHQFEAQIMENPSSAGTQGLHHGYGDGRVVVAVFSGKDPAQFAAVLVHETAHGFVHRLRSNVHIVGWLNEGIADWITGVAVPASNVVSRRQSDALAFLRTHRSMDGFFTPDKRLTSTEYGIASSLTEFMLQTDSNLYRAFLMAIKDGYSLENALKLTYDCNPGELVQSFGNSIGVPDLTP